MSNNYPEPPRSDWADFALLSEAADPEEYRDIWGAVQDDENWRQLTEQVIVPFASFSDIPSPGPFDGAKAEALDSNVVFRWDASAGEWTPLNTGTSSNPVPGTSHYESLSTEQQTTGATGHKRNTGQTVHVFAIGGQSNAGGRGTASESPNLPAEVSQVYYDGSLSATQDPVGPAGDGSAWPSFAKRYYELTSTPTVIVPASEGSSAMDKDADAGSGNWDDTGNLRSRLVTRTNDALTELDNLGYAPEFCGVIWNQGERDAAAGISQSAHQNALLGLIDYWDGEFSDPWSFYLTELGPGFDDDSETAAIRQAQREVVINRDVAKYACDRPRYYNDEGLMQDFAGGNPHFNQQGYNDMGRTTADRIVQGELSILPAATEIGQESSQTGIDNQKFTQLEFDSVSAVDPASQADLSINKINIRESGEYRVEASFGSDDIPDGVAVRLDIRKAGTNIARGRSQTGAGSEPFDVRASGVVNASKGDDLDAQVYIFYSTSTTFSSKKESTRLSAIPLNE